MPARRLCKYVAWQETERCKKTLKVCKGEKLTFCWALLCINIKISAL